MIWQEHATHEFEGCFFEVCAGLRNTFSCHCEQQFWDPCRAQIFETLRDVCPLQRVQATPLLQCVSMQGFPPLGMKPTFVSTQSSTFIPCGAFVRGPHFKTDGIRFTGEHAAAFSSLFLLFASSSLASIDRSFSFYWPPLFMQGGSESSSSKFVD